MSHVNQGLSNRLGMRWAALLATMMFCVTGCSSINPKNWRALPQPITFFHSTGGELAIRSLTADGPQLIGGFSDGYFTTADKNTATIVMYEGPIKAPTQAVTIRMFWNPRAGRTPIDDTATNATIHYVIFTGEDRKEVGIYSGAGFVYPNSGIEGDKLVGGVWQSSLRLTDKSKGFHDRLGQATLEGRFTVKRDENALQPLLHTLYVQIRERLGRSRLIMNDGVDHGGDRTAQRPALARVE